MNASPASTIAHETPLRVSRPVVVPGSVLFGPRLFPWAMLASAATLGMFAPASTALAAPWPFAIALVLFGMPHGAADWAVASSLSKRLGLASRLAGFTGYLVLMAMSLALIALQPSAAALLFLALTMFHFGMADATALQADDDGPVARWGLALGRGMLLLATAFAMHPAQAWAPFEQIGQALSPWASTAWQPEIDSLRRFAVMGVAVGGGLALAGAIARIRVGHRRAAALDLAEHALVVAMAATADPLFAVGCYFLGVHAFRHTRRLACTWVVVAHDPPTSSDSSIAQRILRIHRLSLPLMWPTALCFVPLCWLLGGPTLQGLTVASIAFYMITTLPHHLLGLKLPRPDMPPAAPR